MSKKEAQAKWRERKLLEDPDYFKNYRRKWISTEDNRQRSRDANNRAYHKHKNSGDLNYKMRNRILNGAKKRARELGKDFDLTIEDIIIPTHCPILNIPIVPNLTVSSGNLARDDSPSLDRIDNSLGYVKGNVAVISNKANSYKSDLDLKTVLSLLTYMINLSN